MRATPTDLPDVFVLDPSVFDDERGFFFESWNRTTFRDLTGFAGEFVQDNHSRSVRNVLRGLHYQNPSPQGKLVRSVFGAIWDVAVDIRPGSGSFGDWIGVELSADNKKQLWIPPGFAHGFVTLSEVAEVLYKATDYYDRGSDRSIRYDDPDIGITWPGSDFIVSDKDAKALSLAEAPALG